MEKIDDDNIQTNYKYLNIEDPPFENLHATNKEYVDNKINNIIWERAVSNFYDPKNSLPRNPMKGERFVSCGTGCGWTINRIYEYTGNDDKPWVETIPSKGYIVWVQYATNYSGINQKELTYIFNGLTWDKIGTTIDHSDLRNTGIYSHKKIDDHIGNKTLHIKENQIEHKNIKDIGLYSHNAIDKHIQNCDNAHFGQDLTKNGSPIFHSLRVSDVNMASHVATKEYVDTKIFGIKWLKSVNSFCEKAECDTSCYNGERHICLETSNGWKKNYIYEYNGYEWHELQPIKESAVYVEGGNIFNGCTILYNGNEWIKFGTTGNHENLGNVGIYKHTDIDEHINNNSDAHFGQNLCENSSPSFMNVSVKKNLTTDNINAKTQIVKDIIQIGDFTLPSSHKEFSNFTIIGNNDKLNTTYVYADESSNEPINIIHMRARGDIYKPKEVFSGTPIGALVYSGHDGHTYNVTSTIQCVTTEDYNKNSHGSSIQFSTTKNGTCTPNINMEIGHNGVIHCFCTNNGALIVDGGIGVSKTAEIGGYVKIGGNLMLDNKNCSSEIKNDTHDGFDDQILSLCGGGEMTNKRGSMITISGVNSHMDGKIQLNAGLPHGHIELSTCDKPQFVIDKNGKCEIKCEYGTSSETTGSLTVNGGVGIREKLYVGGSVINLGTHDKCSIKPDTYMGKDTSEFNLCGGGDNANNRGGYISIYGNDNSKGNGSIILNTGNSIHGKIYFSTKNMRLENNSNPSGVIDSSGDWHIYTTTDAVNTCTGALIVDGGVNIKKKLIVNNIKCLNAIQLPLFSDEPICNDLGSLYYDTKRDCVRIYTTHGWRNMSLR